MRKPELPENELSRLNTLTFLSVLDTEEEERFNRLTRIARHAFQVPIALVSLVDENRQWFKSCLGLDIRETPREISFCGHAILGDEILMVPDTLKDPRFSDNPLVTGYPGIRFYAGCPLKVLNARLGTLCVVDTGPRTLDGQALEVLKDLAALVESELLAHHHSTIDELTRIPNRRGLLALLESGLGLCTRRGLESFLLMMDLNNFKNINDSYGHQEGDEVLKLFARAMAGASRSSDVVGRLGGDEFVAWLSDIRQENVSLFLQRLRKSLEEQSGREGKDYRIDFSSGILPVQPGEPEPVASLLERADRLMYLEKLERKAGKGKGEDY